MESVFVLSSWMWAFLLALLVFTWPIFVVSVIAMAFATYFLKRRWIILCGLVVLVAIYRIYDSPRAEGSQAADVVVIYVATGLISACCGAALGWLLGAFLKIKPIELKTIRGANDDAP